MELTLRQIFGSSATQNNDQVIIWKAELPNLTPLNNNLGGQLLAAILLKTLSIFQGTIKDELGDSIWDEAGLTIDYDNSNLYENLLLFPWQTQLIKTESISYIKHTIVFQQMEKHEI